MKSYKFTIDQKDYTFSTDQKTMHGKDEIILDNDINFMESYPEGFTIHKLQKEECLKIKSALKNFIKDEIFKFTGIQINSLSNYHKFIDDDTHANFMKYFSKGFDVSAINELEYLNKEITNVTSIEASPYSPYNKEKKFWMRIIRPGILENNPAHKDVYLDYLRNAVNIYFPITGSTKKSSLSIMPRSHKTNEKDILRTVDGARVGKRNFTVPAILKIKDSLNLTRPNPNENEVMIFSPYLVHGAGINEEEDLTRISLEMRFWPVAGL